MQSTHKNIDKKNVLPIRSPTPPLDSSIEDLDEFCMDQELEKLDDDISGASKKPHFLDYDSIPPPGFEDDDDCCSNVAVKGIPRNIVYSGEHIKVDKKYETDGEISDFELITIGQKRTSTIQNVTDIFNGSVSDYSTAATKSIDSNAIELSTATTAATQINAKHTGGGGGARRKKHFLDENPIPPPDYDIDKEREHRSLDRNFERTKDYDIKYERKHSLDRERVPKKFKEPSYTLARFLDHDATSPVYRGTWPADRPNDTQCSGTFSNIPPSDLKHLGPKVECVYSLLSMLGCNNQSEMSMKFLELSKSPETCATLRHSRCIPLIVQIIHSDADEKTKKRATIALHNVVNCHPDDKAGRREAKVLRHIEQIMEYCDLLKSFHIQRESIADDSERHPLQAICSLMKISFDEEHRHAMCQLGALQAIASLVHYDHAVHGHNSIDERCISLRRYAGMALTNLTFGDGNNKALLCTNREFMKALVAQLNSNADDLLQVTASVLRNLSWRADNNMKTVLNEIGTVTALSKAVMKNKNENTLKALLSALWNLSAHCSTNKAEFCAVEGALAFLVDMLVFEGPSKTLTIIENAGGILRNVSSHIAVKEDYRKILRKRNCLGILLQQLSSESLTVVSNACGTLWNLSARCPEDQKFLLDNKAVSMLSLLIHSKHKMISNGSSAALKNLLNFRPDDHRCVNHNSMDPIAKSMKLKELPSLNVRKQRALEQELDQNLSETCENIEVTTPPKEDKTIDDFIRLDTGREYDTAKIMSASHLSSSSSTTTASLSPKSIKNEIKEEEDGDQIENICNASVVVGGDKQIATDSIIKSDIPKPAPRHSIKKPSSSSTNKSGCTSSSTYQETDLDQLTDFSLRYAENQTEESDTEDTTKQQTTTATDEYGNEILLIIEDSVKCYQTEGTPYVISNAPSVSDLRTNVTQIAPLSKPIDIKNKNIEINDGAAASSVVTAAIVSGTDTPEKPTKYCEEGTPGYFSRYDSFSSLDEEPHANEPVTISATAGEDTSNAKSDQVVEIIETVTQTAIDQPEIDDRTNPTTPGGSTAKAVTFADYAQETPLMFSRHSSLDSLSSAEPAIVDDRSSIISDFSRLASGIISPSEIPDSPTQCARYSPGRRLTNSNHHHPQNHHQQSQTPSSTGGGTPSVVKPVTTTRLRSVFEDDTNAFNVENTPAQFSCATSLSNLSMDDEPKIASDILTKEVKALDVCLEETKNTSIQTHPHTTDQLMQNESLSDSDSSDGEANQIFNSCVNVGMNRGTKPTSENIRDDFGITTTTDPLSDDSTSSSDMGGNDNLLEQCIREGIVKTTTANRPKPRNTIPKPSLPAGNLFKENPIGMLRKGGIPSYMASADETNRFQVEDSPCSYSIISGLSDITIGSGVAGLAKVNREPQIHNVAPSNAIAVDDSLSSISMDSEDDLNILNEAIAAGAKANCNKNAVKSTNIPVGGPLVQLTPMKPQISNHIVTNEANDSLSSIDSSDSNDGNHAIILEQCIRSGMHKESSPQRSTIRTKPITDSTPNENKIKTSSPKRSQLPTFLRSPSHHQHQERERQKERARQDDLLLQECITAGMSRIGITASASRHSNVSSNVIGGRQPLSITSASMPAHQQQQQQQQQQQYRTALQPTTIGGDFSSNVGFSKNGETTSVVVSDIKQIIGATNTAPGVVETEQPILHVGTNERKNDNRQQQQQQHHHPNQLSTMQMIKTGFKSPHQDCLVSSSMRDINVLQMSYGSLNLSSDGNMGLDCSNEYPALKGSDIEFADECDSSPHESSFNMEISNEYMMEQTDENILSPKYDKHKNPDLMLKSVDRLTQELVSTAEYLRTGARTTTTSSSSALTTTNDDDATTMYENKSSSNSNNTWNDDTCPNDVSFPSVSMTVPMIASMNDDNDDATTFSDLNSTKNREWIKNCDLDEATPTNECQKLFIVEDKHECNEEMDKIWQNASLDATLRFDSGIVSNSQPNSLDTESNTIINDYGDDDDDINDEIDYDSGGGGGGSTGNCRGQKYSNPEITFQVGGEVQPTALTSSFKTTASSAMTNSQIIALEANKLVTELLNMQTMSESSTSLDLDNIRPPSGMDCISFSGFYEAPSSLQLQKGRKKSLPLGLMARRALSQATAPSGSLESVNSSCNLDNIKPPSLMDELLDSMISVSSITSEIVDNSQSGMMMMLGGNTSSHYETALSDIDDTTTLRSCLELPNDQTPIPSDFSSAESTPRKVRHLKRTLTPRQKRQMVKERYRTYTIAAENIVKEKLDELQNESSRIDDDDDGQEMQKHQERTANVSKSLIEQDDNDDDDDEVLRIEIQNVENNRKLTPRQRRQGDRLRFQTQVLDIKMLSKNETSPKCKTTISSNCHAEERLLDDTSDTLSLVSHDEEDDDDDSDLASIRALTERFKYIREAAATVSSQTTPTANTSAAILAYNLLNGKLSQNDTDDISSIDYEQNSDTESYDQNQCIDEETYTVPKQQQQNKGKPKIIKPTDNDEHAAKSTTTNTTEPAAESKAIRGKKIISQYRRSIPIKKSIASSPLNRLSNGSPTSSVDKSNKNAIESKKVAAVSKLTPRSQAVVAKTHVLINKATLATKINAGKIVATSAKTIGSVNLAAKRNIVAEKNLINKKKDIRSFAAVKSKVNCGNVAAKVVSSNVDVTKLAAPPPTMPDRQGTFVKDEPTNGADVPVVVSEPSSPAKSTKLPSKLPTNNTTKSGIPTSPAKTIAKLKNPLQRSSSTGGGTAAATKIQILNRPLTSPLCPGDDSAAAAARRRKAETTFYRSPSTPSVPQRCNSNSSIRSATSAKREPSGVQTQPPSRSNSNLGQSKRDVTSRIAGLWKKTTETTPPSSSVAAAIKQAPAAGTVSGKPPSSGNRLIRSSTFESNPTEKKVSPSKLATIKSTATKQPHMNTAIPSALAACNNGGVVRRIKSAGKSTTDETKRISRLGSFINVDETSSTAAT